MEGIALGQLKKTRTLRSLRQRDILLIIVFLNKLLQKSRKTDVSHSEIKL